MSFFPKWALGTDTPKSEKVKRSKQIPDNQKPKPPHRHECQECGFSFRCSIALCNLPDSVLKCYTCNGSNFQTYRI